MVTVQIYTVIAQTYRNLEIVVVDDGSTDNTGEIVKHFAERDARIFLIKQNNAGVAAARNTGISASHGELVAPLDADDICFLTRFAEQVEAFGMADASDSVIYSWSAGIDSESQLTGQVNACKFEGDVAAEMLFSNIVGNASAVLIPRECLERVGLYATEFVSQDAQGCEDRDLYLRMAEYFPFVVVRNIHVGYRNREFSMSSDHAQMSRSHDAMMRRFRCRFPRFSNRLLRRSDAFFLLYLGRKSRANGEPIMSIRYFLKAAMRDLALLFCRDYYSALRVSGIHVVRNLGRKILPRRFHGCRAKASSNCSIEALQTKSEETKQLPMSSLKRLRKRRIQEARKEFQNQGHLLAMIKG